MNYVLLFCLFATSSSEWVSDWMNPVQDELRDDSRYGPHDGFDVILLKDGAPDSREQPKASPKNVLSTTELKMKLETTLQNAKTLAASLKRQINELVSRETKLKEAIANGRHGVSILTVSTINQVPRSYLIRDSHWTLCNGMIQFPVPGQDSQTNLFNELFNEPRCIGREIPTDQDPCVFNSVIKYEVVPTHRSLEYVEEDYFCLKPHFNKTLERYMSVTTKTINDTCKEGVIRSLAENNIECGLRILSEYSFYPHKSSAAGSLPLEYCVEKDSACKLISAWHISNITIENFEFLKNEHKFKKYFINVGSYIGQVA